MREDSALSLLPFSEGSVSRQAFFSAYREALFQDIESSFGWREVEQERRFALHYPSQVAQLVYREAELAGFLVAVEQPSSVHLALMLLLPGSRSRGLGSQLLQLVRSQASERGVPVTLSCFRSNSRVLRFYEERGFRVIASDAHFFSLTDAA